LKLTQLMARPDGADARRGWPLRVR
jgi:hypothetical protein